MTERLVDLQQAKTASYFNHYIANQMEIIENQLESWKNLEDPSEPKEYKVEGPLEENMDEDMFIALRTQLGC